HARRVVLPRPAARAHGGAGAGGRGAGAAALGRARGRPAPPAGHRRGQRRPRRRAGLFLREGAGGEPAGQRLPVDRPAGPAAADDRRAVRARGAGAGGAAAAVARRQRDRARLVRGRAGRAGAARRRAAVPADERARAARRAGGQPRRDEPPARGRGAAARALAGGLLLAAPGAGRAARLTNPRPAILRRRAPATARVWRLPVRIDVHAHYYPQHVLDEFTRLGSPRGYTGPSGGLTVEQRLELMDEAGIDAQVLSMGVGQPYLPDAEKARAGARCANDAYQDLVKRSGGRFAAFGCLPLPHVDAALAETAYCLDELGMAGLNLGCSVAGRPLEDPAFEP